MGQSLELTVMVDEKEYPVVVEMGGDSCRVTMDGKEKVLQTDWCVGEPMMFGTVDEKDVTVHVSEH